MSENAKSNLKKLIVAVVVALAGAGGADAAGLAFDPELAGQLGIGGGLVLVVYLHLQIRPVLSAAATDLAWIRRKLGGEAALDVDAAAGVGPDPEPIVRPTPVPRAASGPVLVRRAPTSGDADA